MCVCKKNVVCLLGIMVVQHHLELVIVSISNKLHCIEFCSISFIWHIELYKQTGMMTELKLGEISHAWSCRALRQYVHATIPKLTNLKAFKWMESSKLNLIYNIKNSNLKLKKERYMVNFTRTLLYAVHIGHRYLHCVFSPILSIKINTIRLTDPLN